ncbi:uncharacterized protein LOC122798682 [Protopterus annectens]|uniref:uncharacterized protein LOC122798682 n=1 Tax=Protopterus annectens TaxID=7888 RepID=UPI001CF9977C|nr:uncharacterized protein LOC122798682 [Protopterus annectens]
MKAFVKQRQREISRHLTPTVQAYMKPAYTVCAKITGQGCLQKMTKHICKFIRKKKTIIFNSVGHTLTKQLTLLQIEIQKKIKLKMRDLHKSLNVQFEPLLNCMKKNEVIIHELIRIYDQVSEICQNSNTEFKLDDLNEEDEECLPSTSGTAKSNTCTKELLNDLNEEDEGCLPSTSGTAKSNTCKKELLNDLNEEDEECLPSTSRTAKSNTCTKELHHREGICGTDNYDGNTFLKICHSPTQTYQKPETTVAVTPSLGSSLSSTCYKYTPSTSFDMSLHRPSLKRGSCPWQIPPVSSKIKITSQGPQTTALEAHKTICSSEDKQEANSSGVQTSNQTDMHPTSAAAPPQKKPGSSDFEKLSPKNENKE